VEKTRSDGAEVAGIESNFIARRDRNGNLD
jgi:hypothetical protein